MTTEKREANKKAVIAHNEKFKSEPFDHAAERKCKLTSGERAMRLIAKYKHVSLVKPGRYHTQALSHGIRTGKHCLTKKDQA